MSSASNPETPNDSSQSGIGDKPLAMTPSQNSSASSDNESDNKVEIIPPEIAKLLPTGAKHSMEMMMQMSGSMPNPVSKKITSEHIKSQKTKPL